LSEIVSGFLNGSGGTLSNAAFGAGSTSINFEEAYNPALQVVQPLNTLLSMSVKVSLSLEIL
jgi:hypothetical protein